MTLPLYFYAGSPLGNTLTGAAFTFNGPVINATTVEGAIIFQIPPENDLTVASIGIRFGSITGSPVLVATIETVSSGRPSGTPVTGATATFTPTSANSMQFFAFDAGATPTLTKGTDYALRVVGTTVDGSNSAALHISLQGTGQSREEFPAILNSTNGGSTWAATYYAGSPIIALKTASNTYFHPFDTTSTPLIGGTTEVGLRFTVPSDMFATYKIAGVRWVGKTGAAGQNIIATLYSQVLASGRTILQQIQLPQSNATVASDGGGIQRRFFNDATLATLTGGHEYVMGFAYDAAAAPSGQYIQAPAAADLEAFPWGGNFYACSRTITALTTGNLPPASGNDFASSATEVKQRPLVDLILTQWTNGGGGTGGMLVHPGMSGGMRG